MAADNRGHTGGKRAKGQGTHARCVDNAKGLHHHIRRQVGDLPPVGQVHRPGIGLSTQQGTDDFVGRLPGILLQVRLQVDLA